MTFGGASPSAVPTLGSSSWGSSAPAAPDSRADGRSSVVRALIGGIEVAVVGAVVWGVVAYVTKHQYSVIALAVGIGIGYMVSRYRRGDPAVAAAAAVLALLACALGTLVALAFAALRGAAGLGHLGAIVQAYPGSVGSLGIVFWLMAAVAAFTYPMGRHTGTSGQPLPDTSEPQPPRPPRVGRPAPGGYGTPQAPSAHDDNGASSAPDRGLALEPPEGSAMAAWDARPATVLGAPSWEAQQATDQMPALRPAAQQVTGQVPALRPAAQPEGWDLQPTPRARHRAPQAAAAEPTTGQWPAAQPAAGRPPAGSSAGEQASALPKRQRSAGRHSRPSAGPMD